MATILTVITTACLIWGLKLSPSQVLAVIIVSLAIVLVEFILRTVYYHKIELNLIRADNRISVLSEIWPEIIDIASADFENGTEDIPPEPEKVFNVYGAEQNTTSDQNIDMDLALIFDSNEEKNATPEDSPTNSIETELWFIEEMVEETSTKEKESETTSQPLSLNEITAKIKALNERLKHLQEGS